MPRTLWLLRHFEAVDNPPAGGRDRDRRLTARGLAAARALGAAIAAGEIGSPPPSYVLSSPAARTTATAEGAFGSLDPPPALAVDRRLYHATPDDVLEIVRELPDEIDVVGVVGHNPTVHCLSLDLVDEEALVGPHPATAKYPPGTLSVIILPIRAWAEAAWSQGVLELLC